MTGAGKGEYGYRSRWKKQQLLLVSLCVLAILIQLAVRQAAGSQAMKNILTVMAVLTVLPMANVASPMIAGWRFSSAPTEVYERIKGYEDRALILYDLVITSKNQFIPADAAAVHQRGVYLYCSRKVDAEKAEAYLNETFKAHKLDERVRILATEQLFLKRLSGLEPTPETEDDGSAGYAAKLLKNLSM